MHIMQPVLLTMTVIPKFVVIQGGTGATSVLTVKIGAKKVELVLLTRKFLKGMCDPVPMYGSGVPNIDYN